MSGCKAAMRNIRQGEKQEGFSPPQYTARLGTPYEDLFFTRAGEVYAVYGETKSGNRA